jgi:predicted transcriptional regulator
MVKRNVEPAKTDEVKEKSVEELLSRLDAIKAQQEELDKAKKETVTLLKEKVKQQKQRLQNLGVNIEEEGGLKVTPSVERGIESRPR